jgi:integrase
VESLLARFFELKAERGCLPTTVSRYQWAIRKGLGHLRQARRSTDPRKWSVDDARFLRTACKEDPWRVTILASLARFARNFVFYEVGLPPKPPPRRVRWLTEEQARAISEVTRGDPLLRLVALLGIGQGLRRIEWLRLRLEDLDFPGGRMLVRGKGRGQPKIVWMAMHPALPAAIAEYLPLRERVVRRELRRTPHGPIPPELLIHRWGGKLIPYGEGGANRWMLILQRRLAARGLSVKMSSHMLRRSGATLLEKALLDSPNASRDGVYRRVQEFLRHDNLATTMRYLDRDPSRQRQALETFARALDWGPSARDWARGEQPRIGQTSTVGWEGSRARPAPPRKPRPR